MTTTTHRLIDEYLQRLERAARVLPRRDREELLAEIRSHLDAGLPPQATEADIRNLLDDLGPPDSIVAAARPDRRAARRGPRELFALLLPRAAADRAAALATARPNSPHTPTRCIAWTHSHGAVSPTIVDRPPCYAHPVGSARCPRQKPDASGTGSFPRCGAHHAGRRP